MEYSKNLIKSCCGKDNLVIKLPIPTDEEFMKKLIDLGYEDSPFLTRAGVLYVENNSMIVSGSFTSNSLQLKCKTKDCSHDIQIIEDLIKSQ